MQEECCCTFKEKRSYCFSMALNFEAQVHIDPGRQSGTNADAPGKGHSSY
jgi:hypothetical protein